jgi:hypothetical protein
MSELKTALYVFFIFLMLAVPILFFSGRGMEGITGHATAVPQSNPVGDYRIKPDFSLTLKNSLDQYAGLRSSARDMVGKVQKCQDSLGKCVQQNIPAGWSVDCGNPDERLFMNVVENYLLCTESEDMYCACDIPIQLTPAQAGKDYEIYIDTTPDSTVFSMGSLKMTVPGAVKVDTTKDGITAATSDTYRFGWEIGFGADKVNHARLYLIPIAKDELGDYYDRISLFVFMGVPIVRQTTYDYDTQFAIYKTPSSVMFMNPDERKSISARTCQPAKKHISTFCVDSGIKADVSQENIIYRFALDFSVDTIPLQPSFIVADTPKTKQSLSVSWTSLDKDIDHYNIYCSKSSYTRISDLPVALRVESGTAAQLTSCPEKDVSSTIRDGTPYYVAVVPVDRSNNYQKDVVRAISAVSLDDTPPPTTI